ncbi:hypothetical protein Bbelb_187950 [Branchiostoma belcheri]|nr:hypothetical protein Bbelb_187950 [Branchiostoma belcheri]
MGRIRTHNLLGVSRTRYRLCHTTPQRVGDVRLVLPQCGYMKWAADQPDTSLPCGYLDSTAAFNWATADTSAEKYYICQKARMRTSVGRSNTTSGLSSCCSALHNCVSPKGYGNGDAPPYAWHKSTGDLLLFGRFLLFPAATRRLFLQMYLLTPANERENLINQARCLHTCAGVLLHNPHICFPSQPEVLLQYQGPTSCTADQFACPCNSCCLETAQLCDRVNDCTDGSDEAGCVYPTTEGPTTTPVVTTTTPAVTTVLTTTTTVGGGNIAESTAPDVRAPSTASTTTSRPEEGGSAAANTAPVGAVAGGVVGAVVVVGAGAAVVGYMLYKKKQVSVEPVKLLKDMLDEGHPLHDLVPPARTTATERTLRNGTALTVPAAPQADQGTNLGILGNVLIV